MLRHNRSRVNIYHTHTSYIINGDPYNTNNGTTQRPLKKDIHLKSRSVEEQVPKGEVVVVVVVEGKRWVIRGRGYGDGDDGIGGINGIRRLGRLLGGD